MKSVCYFEPNVTNHKEFADVLNIAYMIESKMNYKNQIAKEVK